MSMMVSILAAAQEPASALGGNNVNLASFLFAVAALMVAGLSPLAAGFFQRRAARRDKAEDRKQRNEVAAKAAEVAAQLLSSNAKVAELAQKANIETAASLAAIHALVNSNLTTAQERELEASRAMLASMREVISMKEDRNLPVTDDTIKAIKVVETRIQKLAHDLVQKREKTELAERLLTESY